ncbi:MAG: IS30 family transposase [Erysipelotrichaceae bacterium]|nr:IS30 family transposase [Erysipelotrichaceae bacterium]
MRNKHLTSDDRKVIEQSLNIGLSFKAIGKLLDKDCTTISKEVRKNYTIKKTGFAGMGFNECINRFECSEYFVCDSCTRRKKTKCKLCGLCPTKCSRFEKECCANLSKPPYVCNHCNRKFKCTLAKHLYHADSAQTSYDSRLSESRSGFIINENQIQRLNHILNDLVKEKDQSIHHVFINHKDELMMSEKTLYTLIDSCVLNIRNIDLTRKVRFSPRRKKSNTYKVDKKCLVDRTYEDYLKFIELHPDMALVEMDSVEGVKGGSCLLTIHFKTPSFMIAVKRDFNDSASVTKFFNDIYTKLGHERFQQLFPVILTDNGSEFSNPSAIEFNDQGERRTYVFYCHPSSPEEKGECESNHRLLRYFVPKGKN